jgi:hypothetical protein
MTATKRAAKLGAAQAVEHTSPAGHTKMALVLATLESLVEPAVGPPRVPGCRVR